MKASSKVGSIEIVGDTIQITRAQAFGFPAESRVIKIDHLTGIEFRKSGIESGYLKVIHPGSTSSSSTLAVKAYDQDVVRFDKKDEAAFLVVRAELMERLTGQPFVEDEAPTDKPPQWVAGCGMAAIALIVLLFLVAIANR